MWDISDVDEIKVEKTWNAYKDKLQEIQAEYKTNIARLERERWHTITGIVSKKDIDRFKISSIVMFPTVKREEVQAMDMEFDMTLYREEDADSVHTLLTKYDEIYTMCTNLLICERAEKENLVKRCQAEKLKFKEQTVDALNRSIPDRLVGKITFEKETLLPIHIIHEPALQGGARDSGESGWATNFDDDEEEDEEEMPGSDDDDDRKIYICDSPPSVGVHDGKEAAVFLDRIEYKCRYYGYPRVQEHIPACTPISFVSILFMSKEDTADGVVGNIDWGMVIERGIIIWKIWRVHIRTNERHATLTDIQNIPGLEELFALLESKAEFGGYISRRLHPGLVDESVEIFSPFLEDAISSIIVASMANDEQVHLLVITMNGFTVSVWIKGNESVVFDSHGTGGRGVYSTIDQLHGVYILVQRVTQLCGVAYMMREQRYMADVVNWEAFMYCIYDFVPKWTE